MYLDVYPWQSYTAQALHSRNTSLGDRETKKSLFTKNPFGLVIRLKKFLQNLDENGWRSNRKMGVSIISRSISHFFAVWILYPTFKLLRAIARGIAGVWEKLEPIRTPLRRVFIYQIAVPIYQFFFTTGVRLDNTLASARGFFFLLFTNKYIIQALFILVAISTVSWQMEARAATAETGRSSILYALVSTEQSEIVEDSIEASSPTQTASHYLSENTIEAVPDIDFDYTYLMADEAVPGSIGVGEQVPLAQEEIEAPTDRIVERTKTENYTVATGDTVSTIAHKFGVDVGTIINANGLTKSASIKPGQTLKIPPVSGVLHVVKRGDTVTKLAQLYKADQEKIMSVNQLASASDLGIGDEIVIPDGVAPVTAVPKPTVAVRPNVPKTTIAQKNYDTYQEVDNDSTDTRTKPADAVVSTASKMVWPTSGHVITQYYGWNHTGVDIDGDYTSPIYAVEDGTVVEAGWNNGGYGLQIVIDHPDGKRTRYAHSSKMFVKVGDKVKKGQTIAMVGTTGRSTGTHLHFEVYVNGKRGNPLTYVR